jgi:hypothetical protein
MSLSVRTGLESQVLVRWPLLLALGMAGVYFYQHILAAGYAVSGQGGVYIVPGIGVALVAVLGAWLVLHSPVRVLSRKLWQQSWMQWGELGLIVITGLAFRSVFWGALPMVSHDAYRYVWDAHLVSHGISPYLYPASDPALIPLRDQAIWPQLDWPNAPTIYPPGAQLFFLLVNALAPLDIMAMKLAMGICDVGVGAVTVLLLRHYSLDLRRVIVYWWNPIPVVEFFYNAHVDAVAVLWALLAVLLSLQRWRHARTLAGIALGGATGDFWQASAQQWRW